MPSLAEKAATFQALHARMRGFVVPNAWDAGSARLLEGLGFEAIATTSGGHAFSMGAADGALGRDQVLENARQIVEATRLPVTADLLNCFGERPETVAETIRMAGAIGLVGGSVEDTTGDPQAPLYDPVLSLERVQAAVEAARALPHPFILTVRSDGMFARALRFEAALERLVAYAACGPDCVYLPGLSKPEQVRTVLAAVRLPVNVLGGIGVLTDANALLDLGVQRISTGSALYAAAIGAFLRAADELKAGGFGFRSSSAPYAEMQATFARPPQG